MIVVEGYADKALIVDMGFPIKQIKIGSDKGKVLKSVRKGQAAIGIIDEDPDSGQPSDLRENYIEKDSKRTIKLLVRKDDVGKRIIQIAPRLEDWLYSRARQNRIDPMSFDLPKYPEDLHKILRVDKNKNFRRFLKKLIEADDEIDTLKRWVLEVI